MGVVVVGDVETKTKLPVERYDNDVLRTGAFTTRDVELFGCFSCNGILTMKQITPEVKPLQISTQSYWQCSIVQSTQTGRV